MIDPTARISSTATIADDVEIGPNVIVGEHSSIGSGTKVMANAVIGPWTTIGVNNTIHYGAIVGHDPQDFGYHGEECYAEIGAKTGLASSCAVTWPRSVLAEKPLQRLSRNGAVWIS